MILSFNGLLFYRLYRRTLNIPTINLIGSAMSESPRNGLRPWLENREERVQLRSFESPKIQDPGSPNKPSFSAPLNSLDSQQYPNYQESQSNSQRVESQYSFGERPSEELISLVPSVGGVQLLTGRPLLNTRDLSTRVQRWVQRRLRSQNLSLHRKSPSGISSLSPERYGDWLNALRIRSPERLVQDLFPDLGGRRTPKDLPDDLDPEDLAQVGWGCIFPMGKAGGPIREALEPLLRRRKQQARSLYREDLRVLPDEDAFRFLSLHGSGRDVLDPTRLPYYLLLVGTPEEISWKFQYELGTQHCVGRLAFDGPPEVVARRIGRYVESLLRCEEGRSPRQDYLELFAPQHPDDPSTAQSLPLLGKSLKRALEAPRNPLTRRWLTDETWGGSATKSRLLELLQGRERRPAALFTMGHGLAIYRDEGLPEERQREIQGALLCAGWQGPLRHSGPLSSDMYLSVADVQRSSMDLSGLVTQHFACFSAGSPRIDSFGALESSTARVIASTSFVASLPQAMLSLPDGRAALGVIGHVDLAWESSFQRLQGEDSQIDYFAEAARKLLRGAPIGLAQREFSRRYGRVAVQMATALLQHLHRGSSIDSSDARAAFGLEILWMAHQDSRAFVLLGDPAARNPTLAAERRGWEMQRAEPAGIHPSDRFYEAPYLSYPNRGGERHSKIVLDRGQEWPPGDSAKNYDPRFPSYGDPGYEDVNSLDQPLPSRLASESPGHSQWPPQPPQPPTNILPDPRVPAAQSLLTPPLLGQLAGTDDPLRYTGGFAVLVGVGGDLPATVEDAKALHRQLTDPELCAYPPEQVLLLTEAQATRQGFLSALDWLAQAVTRFESSTRQTATAIVYFSGHGTDGEPQRLVTHDYSIDRLNETSITAPEFTQRLRSIRSERLLVLLDCCHAAGQADAKNRPSLRKNAALPVEDLTAFSEGRGRVVLASSRSDEFSYVHPLGKMSQFTKALTEALSGHGRIDPAGSIGALDVAFYTAHQVPQRTLEAQNPVLKVAALDQDFAIARYPTEDRLERARIKTPRSDEFTVRAQLSASSALESQQQQQAELQREERNLLQVQKELENGPDDEGRKELRGEQSQILQRIRSLRGQLELLPEQAPSATFLSLMFSWCGLLSFIISYFYRGAMQGYLPWQFYENLGTSKAEVNQAQFMLFYALPFYHVALGAAHSFIQGRSLPRGLAYRIPPLFNLKLYSSYYSRLIVQRTVFFVLLVLPLIFLSSGFLKIVREGEVINIKAAIDEDSFAKGKSRLIAAKGLDHLRITEPPWRLFQPDTYDYRLVPAQSNGKDVRGKTYLPGYQTWIYLIALTWAYFQLIRLVFRFYQRNPAASTNPLRPKISSGGTT